MCSIFSHRGMRRWEEGRSSPQCLLSLPNSRAKFWQSILSFEFVGLASRAQFQAFWSALLATCLLRKDSSLLAGRLHITPQPLPRETTNGEYPLEGHPTRTSCLVLCTAALSSQVLSLTLTLIFPPHPPGKHLQTVVPQAGPCCQGKDLSSASMACQNSSAAAHFGKPVRAGAWQLQVSIAKQCNLAFGSLPPHSSSGGGGCLEIGYDIYCVNHMVQNDEKKFATNFIASYTHPNH